MDQLPIRIKLDFTGLDNADYEYVWYPVMRRNLSHIADLKQAICAKYDLDHDRVDLFLAGALLREDDTILLLREDDNIQVMSKQKPPRDVKSSRKRKRKREIADKMNGDSACYDKPKVLAVRVNDNEPKSAKKVKKGNGCAERRSMLRNSVQVINADNADCETDALENPCCSYSENDGDNIYTLKKRKKEKHRKQDFSPGADIIETCDVNDNVSKKSDSVMSKTSFEILDLNSCKREMLTSGCHIETNGSSSMNKDLGAAKVGECSSVGVSPVRFQNSVNAESSFNCPKKKRKRRRKRKSGISEKKLEVVSTCETLELAFEVSVPSPKVEPKNKHIRFENSAENGHNVEKQFSALIDECKNSFLGPIVELTNNFAHKDSSHPPNLSSSPGKLDIDRYDNNTQHKFALSEQFVFGTEKPVSCEQYLQESAIHNSPNSVKVSASPEIDSRPLGNCKTVVIGLEEQRQDSEISNSLMNTKRSRQEAPIAQTKNLMIDYDTYPQLHVVPPVGALIAFKLLELSDLYCPEVSDYKEGVVVEFDKTADTITVQLQKEEIKKRKTGKFENVYESDEENEPEPDIVKRITCKWMDLISPRLLVPSSLPTISSPQELSFHQP